MNSSENSPSTSDLGDCLEALRLAGLRFHYLMWLPEGEWWLVVYKHDKGMQQMFHGKSSSLFRATRICIENWTKFFDIYGWPPVRPMPVHFSAGGFTRSSPLELDIKI